MAGLAVLILAAGRGTRMKSQRPKALHEIAGLPMLAYPLALAEGLAAEPVVVVGSGGEQVQQAFAGRARFVTQSELKGTGHAAQTGLAALGAGDEVLILYADCPLLRAESLAQLRALKQQSGAALALLSSPEPLPGRVVRNAAGAVERIVEITDATPEEQRIQEGNTGVYLVEREFLSEALAELDSGNRQSELYLTDIVAAARRRGLQVEALRLDDAEEALGVNDRAELARACAVQRRRNVARWLAEGVSFTDPATAYVDTQAELGPDCVIGPGVVIAGASRLGRGVQVKAHSVIEDSLLEDGVVVGPCAHLRPGATLRQGARVGNFVEVKNSELGPGVKADHLAYIGDADVGANSSFGCGAITVNYDWEQKHRTRVGAGVRIGCNANLIAPVALADGAYVAAGATVTKPVPGGAIAVSSGRQRNIEGFGKRRAAKARARDAERG